MIKLVLKHRSLGENNPLNLLKFQALKDHCNKIGENAFIDYVYRVLEDNE